MTKKM